ncbi:MAG: hypothetical protein OXD44_12320 [Gammaproteobacteria bacterium]|nr:hypothetical protein [Gammaproteobacteria bacterium]
MPAIYNLAEWSNINNPVRQLNQGQHRRINSLDGQMALCPQLSQGEATGSWKP